MWHAACRRCPAYGKVCHNCSKKNHYAQQCQNQQSKVHAVDEGDSDEFYVDVVTEQNTDKKDLMITLKVNETHIALKLDTGAQANVMSEATFNNIRLGLQLFHRLIE